MRRIGFLLAVFACATAGQARAGHHAEPGCDVGWEGCGEDLCCGDDLGCCDGVGCGSSCGAGCPCDINCGLLGKGILTHDPCGGPSKLPKLLLGKLFLPSECGFDEFISPISNPIFFEDPRNTTELRGLFWNHVVPDDAAGGQVNLYALQIRARLTDKLSLIATKDGYVTSTNPLIDDGWGDFNVGFKYAVHRDVRNQSLASIGFTYNAPFGSTRTHQARGDGNFHLFATGGKEIFDCGHWVTAVGGNLPVDAAANSSFVYWSNHFDYQVRKGWYAVMEYNWFHWTDGGDNAAGLTGVEGFDAFNFGSSGVDNNDIVTGAFGFRYKPNPKHEIGVAYEVPLTDRRDVIENRLNVDLILRY